MWLRRAPPPFCTSEQRAEGEGFEPSETCASTVFKTVPFGRSGTPPPLRVGGLRSDDRRPACVLHEQRRREPLAAGQTELDPRLAVLEFTEALLRGVDGERLRVPRAVAAEVDRVALPPRFRDLAAAVARERLVGVAVGNLLRRHPQVGEVRLADVARGDRRGPVAVESNWSDHLCLSLSLRSCAGR